MTAADPFTRASQTWAPARATDARRTIALEELPPERTALIRMIRSALIGGIAGWAVVIGFILLVKP